MSDTKNLTDYVLKCSESLVLLHAHQQYEAAISLWYVYVEQLSWLSTSKDNVHPEDFKHWIKDYILPEIDSACSADDFWAARCGLLHMGTAQSSHVVRGDAASVYYYSGNVTAQDSQRLNYKFVNVTQLLSSYIAGAVHFIDDIEHQPEKIQRANEKLSNMLSFTKTS
ncbi:hypothetical protein WH43_05905 [Rheinheimera sp. KL1]|uniref:hypothetical protein n=1 Tax=Rheinheimera sp. KL1 TaxID=1635005 RepID=UPI0006A9842A|nr:hypothetical protein [Rheinheimera sp. KL1]KOO59112.1 hypothetical protein WH43_05905 [Rheinheimera sp. KL1]